MKRPLTFLAFILAISGPAIAFYGYGVTGAACCVLADFLAFAETKAVTGRIQLSCFIFSNLCMGISLDTLHGGFPWFTVALPCICGASSTRLLLFTSMGYTRFPWYEPLMVFIGSGLYITANLNANIGWAGWAFPAIPIFFGVFTMMGGFMDRSDFAKSKNTDYEVKPGVPVPEFSLPDHEGNEVDLGELKGKRNLLLLFVRGDWCPSCHIMLRTYEKNRELFQQKDVMLLAIGPDPVGVNKKMVLSLGLDYKILADEKQQVVKRFGIQTQGPNFAAKYEGGIPMPASFLVDKSGIVRFTSRADRAGDFLNPNKIFDILPSLPGV